MKSVYRRAVAERFHAAFSEQFPQFVVRQGRDRDMPGSRLYRHIVSDSLVLFVYLIIHDNFDKFNLDIGHGPDDGPPVEDFFVNPAAMADSPAALFRLTEFWDERDPWWVVEPYQPSSAALSEQTYLPQVELLVKEAVSRLMEYGQPYFTQVIARHDGSNSVTVA